MATLKLVAELNKYGGICCHYSHLFQTLFRIDILFCETKWPQIVVLVGQVRELAKKYCSFITFILQALLPVEALYTYTGLQMFLFC